MRTPALTLVLALLLWPAARAWATAQEPERLVLDGQVLFIQSTPLAPLVEAREDLEQVFEVLSTGCWRGYVGTWHIEGDRLYLVSLDREDYDPDLEVEGSDEPGGSVWEKIPLSVLFGDVQPPIPATWFSGTLRVPKSPGRDYVHMGFGTTYDRELHLDIERGRVVSRRLVDMVADNRGRSGQDVEWVALASAGHTGPPVRDDGQWIDARSIPTAGFGEAHPQDTPFVTRGILDRDDDNPVIHLWIPETGVTPAVVLPLASSPPWPGEMTWPHVELEATWTTKGGRPALRVRWFRLLEPGETIHHPAYPLPPLAPGEAPDPNEILDPEEFLWVESPLEVKNAFGIEGIVTLHGPLDEGPVPQVHGVDVAAAPELANQDVLVVGVLEKWIVTERLLRLDLPAIEPFRKRGPGTYYRLVHPISGRLATPLRAE